MIPARIVFMGTPPFAATVLEGLIKAGYSIIGLISQPDRPVGRKQIIEPTATKKVALENQIPVFQPEKIKKEFQFLYDLKPDIIITCAYGQIVPQAVLDIPPKGCLNVHGSLLPKWRGGAPIQRSLMAGDKETGITLMQMIDKMDAGVMYGQIKTPIEVNDTTSSLFIKLALQGRDFLLQLLDPYLEGKLVGIPQKEEEVTYAWNLKPEEEWIDWTKPAIEIERLVRAFLDQPGAIIKYKGMDIKVWKVTLGEAGETKDPGTILQCSKKGLQVQAGHGTLWIQELQLPGKKRMEFHSFIQGNHLFEELTKLG